MSGDRPDLSSYAAGGPKRVPVDTDDRDPVDPPAPRPSTPLASTSRTPAPAIATGEETVQFNVRLSRSYREQLETLRAAHPTDRRATLRDVVEAAIDALTEKWEINP